MPCDGIGRPFAPLFWRSLGVVAFPQSHASVPSKVVSQFSGFLVGSDDGLDWLVA